MDQHELEPQLEPEAAGGRKNAAKTAFIMSLASGTFHGTSTGLLVPLPWGGWGPSSQALGGEGCNFFWGLTGTVALCSIVVLASVGFTSWEDAAIPSAILVCLLGSWCLLCCFTLVLLHQDNICLITCGSN